MQKLLAIFLAFGFSDWRRISPDTWVTGHSKKVYRDLDHVEKCGFLHGVQRVSNNIFEVFLDIANF